MSNPFYASDPDLAEFAETMETLSRGRSDVVLEPTTEALWQSIAGEAFAQNTQNTQNTTSLSEFAARRTESADVSSGRAPRSSGRLFALSSGIAAAVILMLMVPLGLAWRSSQNTRVDSTAQLATLGDFANDGSATLRGSSLEIEVAALPDNADSSYELWLIDIEGGDIQDLTSLGQIDASGVFEVPEGIDPQQYSVVDVSLEPDDGNPEHSGASVLRGELTAS